MIRFSLLAALLGPLVPAAIAQVNINWGTSFVEQKMTLSDGTTGFDTSAMNIQLGSFGSGFTPTLENAADWSANWKVFDGVSTFLNSGNDTTARFAGSDTLNVGQTSASPEASPSHTFTSTEQAYVWVFNQQSVDSTTEWALYTRTTATSWTYPNVTGDPQTPLNWYLSQADTAIIGAVNGGSGAGGSTGAGYTDDTSEDYFIRTHRIQPIPEPGTAALAWLGALLLGTRRRR